MESDLSVFHRIDAPLEQLHPQRLIDLAVRLGFYPGVVQARLRAEAAEEDALAGGGVNLNADRVVSSDLGAMAIDPVLGGLIEIG